MYVPDHFRPTDDDVDELLATIGAADLITRPTTACWRRSCRSSTSRPAVASGEHGRLLGHVARNNHQWKLPPIGEAMVIVRGPDAYISPAWYATKREHGRVVPTWNYVTAHVHGELVVHDDPRWLERSPRAHRAPRGGAAGPVVGRRRSARLIEGQLRAIVGVEVVITRIEAKLKLSQNRSEADVDGAIEGLARSATRARWRQPRRCARPKPDVIAGDPARPATR